jgi:hypothetical protein
MQDEGSHATERSHNHVSDHQVQAQRGAVEQGKIVGQKLPLKLHEIWVIRTRLVESWISDIGLDRSP